jgi:hypothetical protein
VRRGTRAGKYLPGIFVELQWGHQRILHLFVETIELPGDRIRLRHGNAEGDLWIAELSHLEVIVLRIQSRGTVSEDSQGKESLSSPRRWLLLLLLLQLLELDGVGMGESLQDDGRVGRQGNLVGNESPLVRWIRDIVDTNWTECHQEEGLVSGELLQDIGWVPRSGGSLGTRLLLLALLFSHLMPQEPAQGVHIALQLPASEGEEEVSGSGGRGMIQSRPIDFPAERSARIGWVGEWGMWSWHPLDESCIRKSFRAIWEWLEGGGGGGWPVSFLSAGSFINSLKSFFKIFSALMEFRNAERYFFCSKAREVACWYCLMAIIESPRGQQGRDERSKESKCSPASAHWSPISLTIWKSLGAFLILSSQICDKIFQEAERV